MTGGARIADWEQAAGRFADLIAPCRDAAGGAGRDAAGRERVAVQRRHPHRPHARRHDHAGRDGRDRRLHRLSRLLDRGRPEEKFERAMPVAGLVQVSDYVLGDRTTPCRAVPGDGAIPLERIIGDVLDAGYAGRVRPRTGRPADRQPKERPMPPPHARRERLSEILTTAGSMTDGLWRRTRRRSAARRLARRSATSSRTPATRCSRTPIPRAPLHARRRLPLPDAEPRARPSISRWRPRTRPIRRSTLSARRPASWAATLPISPIGRRGSTATTPTGSPARGAPRAGSTSPCRARGRRRSPAPTGRRLHEPFGDIPEANIFGHQIETDGDGNFELYIGGPERAGKLAADHAGQRKLFIREAFDAWFETPTTLSIERVGMDGPAPDARRPSAMIEAIDWAGDFVTGAMRDWPEHSWATSGGVCDPASVNQFPPDKTADTPTTPSAGAWRPT